MIQKLRSLAGKVYRLSNQLYGYVLIRRSGLFDPAWYLAHNPDVAQAGGDPCLHFVRHGGFEGRDPSPDFSSAGYIEAYPDIKAAGANPLVHYLRHGKAEGRLAKPTEVKNISGFICRILDLIRESSYHIYSKSEEFFVAPRWNSAVNFEYAPIKRKELQEATFAKLKQDYDMLGLETTYNLLSDEYSKEMLLRVIVGRVMGPSRCRFPLYYSHIWKYFNKIDELQKDETHITVGMWDFYVYDLAPIGFNIKLLSDKMIVFIDFILEQYRYQNKVFASTGDYVIDGGACYGDTALYFSELVKDTGKVFSFEFIQNNLEYFRKNIQLNPEKKNIIELIESPLWSNSTTKFSAFESGAGSRLITASGGESTKLYQTISIDDFVKRNGIKRIDFIKLDIEGAELETLKGATETIKKFKPRLAICLYHKNSDFWEIPQYLNSINPDYDLYLDHFVTTPLYETVLFACTRG